MNLTDLTQTATCKKCEGRPITCKTCGLHDGHEWESHNFVALRCLRCKAHPGIDPDVIQDGYYLAALREEDIKLAVVVPLEDTDGA